MKGSHESKENINIFIIEGKQLPSPHMSELIDSSGACHDKLNYYFCPVNESHLVEGMIIVRGWNILVIPPKSCVASLVFVILIHEQQP